MANLLIQYGANVNLQSANGLSPLHVAANNENLKFGEVLIKNGAVVDAVDHKEVTPLQLAAFKGNGLQRNFKSPIYISKILFHMERR